MASIEYFTFILKFSLTQSIVYKMITLRFVDTVSMSRQHVEAGASEINPYDLTTVV